MIASNPHVPPLVTMVVAGEDSPSTSGSRATFGPPLLLSHPLCRSKLATRDHDSLRAARGPVTAVGSSLKILLNDPLRLMPIGLPRTPRQVNLKRPRLSDLERMLVIAHLLPALEFSPHRLDAILVL